MRAPKLTPEELSRWVDEGVDAAEAQRWYNAMYERCGPPTPEAWDMEFNNERPSDCALIWARYWIDEFSAADFDDAAPWIPHFPAPSGGAEYARDFYNAGWGTPGRPPETAGRFQRANVAPDAALQWHDAGFTAEQTDKFLDTRVSPADAQRWLDAGISPDKACKFIAARISVDEAVEADYDDATLDTLAALLRGSPVTRPTG